MHVTCVCMLLIVTTYIYIHIYIYTYIHIYIYIIFLYYTHTQTLFTYTDTHADRHQTNVLFWPLFTEPTDSFVQSTGSTAFPSNLNEAEHFSPERHPTRVSQSPTSELLKGFWDGQRKTACTETHRQWRQFNVIVVKNMYLHSNPKSCCFLLPVEGWDSKVPLQRRSPFFHTLPTPRRCCQFFGWHGWPCVPAEVAVPLTCIPNFDATFVAMDVASPKVVKKWRCPLKRHGGFRMIVVEDRKPDFFLALH